MFDYEEMSWQEREILSGSAAASTREGRRGYHDRYSRANELDSYYGHESGEENNGDNSWVYDAQ